jgi:hypothetical protein
MAAETEETVVVQVKPKMSIMLGEIEVEYKGKVHTPKSLVLHGEGDKGHPPGAPGDVIRVPLAFYERHKDTLMLVTVPATTMAALKPAKTPKTPAAQAPEPGPAASTGPKMKEELELLGLADLRKMAKAANLDSTGTRKDLIDRLMERD